MSIYSYFFNILLAIIQFAGPLYYLFIYYFLLTYLSIYYSIIGFPFYLLIILHHKIM